MPAEPNSQIQDRLLAGVQAGVLGALVMLLYFSMDALLHRQRIVSPEIILGSAVYGNYAIWHGTAKVVLAGVGFQIVMGAFAGIVCAFAISGIRSTGVLAMLGGVAFSLCWYLLWYFVLLPRFAPLIPMYTLRTSAVAAHILLGLVLSRLPAMYNALREPEPVQTQKPEHLRCRAHP